MLSRKVFIYFYLLLFRLKWYALAQSDLCTFDSSFVRIECDRSNPLLHIRESEYGCSGHKCWCILYDNQNYYNDGEVIVELEHTFRENLYPGEIQSSIVHSHRAYRVFPNLNRWVVTTNEATGGSYRISTIKINNNEICRFSSSVQRYDVEETNRFYLDCTRRPGYTENGGRYCHTDRQEFVIEKRYTRNGEGYWCIIINNDKNVLTSADHLHIDYLSQYQHKYSPGAYIGRDQLGSGIFHLGSPQTVIAIIEYNKRLTNQISVTINNQPICIYYELRQSNNNFNPSYPTFEPPPVTQRSVETSTSHPQECGMKPTKKNALIAFGTNTEPGDWPWHAAIYKHKSIANRILICGGTLIGHKTIITAAHCVIESNKVVTDSRLSVELGRHSLGDITSMATPLRVYNVIPHINYNLDTYENDIAILVLATYVEITKYVNYVCLPQPHEMFENRIGTTVGWELHHDSETDLKEVTLPVVPDIICLESNRPFFGEYLTETNFCAGYMNKTNVCRGDSGGGLVFNTNGQWFLGGITSLGVLSKTDDRSCDLKQYVIFTNVAEYLPWIKEHS